MIKTHSSTKIHTLARGFTIVELLIVIVIIGILASITVAAYSGIRARADLSATKQTASSAQRTLMTDKAVLGVYPSTLAEANQGQGIEQGGFSYMYTHEGSGATEGFCLTVTRRDAQVSVSNEKGVTDGLICPGHEQPGAAEVIEYANIAYPTASATTSVPISTVFQPSDVLVTIHNEHYIAGDALIRINGTAQAVNYTKSFYIGAKIIQIGITTGLSGSITMDVVNDSSSVDMAYYVVRGVNNPSAVTLNSAGWESDGDATNKSSGFIRSLPSDSFSLGQLAIMIADGSVGNITFPLNEIPAGWTVDRTSSPVASAHIAATEDSATVSSDLQLSASGYVAGGILVLGE